MSMNLGNNALFNNSINSKKMRYIILGALIGLCLLYFLRSCSSSHSEGYYKIGQDTRWRDFYLKDRNRNLVAFNNELLTSIAKQENFLIRLIPTSIPMSELENGKVEGILTALQPSYLHKNLLFSDPFFLIGPVLIVSSQSYPQQKRIKNIIGIPENSPLLSSLEQDPSIQIKIYDDILPALADLRDRRIDGAIFPAIPAYTFTETFYKHELKVATLPLTDEGIRIATLKTDTGQVLIEKFNEGLKSLREKGTYNEILHRWGLIDTEYLSHQEKHPN